MTTAEARRVTVGSIVTVRGVPARVTSVTSRLGIASPHFRLVPASDQPLPGDYGNGDPVSHTLCALPAGERAMNRDQVIAQTAAHGLAETYETNAGEQSLAEMARAFNDRGWMLDIHFGGEGEGWHTRIDDHHFTEAELAAVITQAERILHQA